MLKRLCLDCPRLTVSSRCEPCRIKRQRAFERGRSASKRERRALLTTGDGAQGRARRNKQGKSCAKCSRSDARLEADHIVPLRDGGTDVDDNVQLLCVYCHREKTAVENARRRLGRVGDDR